VLRGKLLDSKSKFAKDYLKTLVNEIRADDNEAEISGNYSALASAILDQKKGTKKCLFM
jgi:site-specific DNA recombinase